MYKVIIADDDKNICEGLRDNIDWTGMGFEIVGVVQDGMEIIEEINSMPIDVIFTDIKMKTISGLDVAKFVYDNQIPCKIVFISGFREFDLAHKAMKYGVQDYILKPCNEEVVCEVFKKIRDELDRNSKDQELIKKVEARWTEMKPFLEEQLLNELITGILHEKNEIIQKIRLLFPDIDVERCPCMILEWKLQGYEQLLSAEWKYTEDQIGDAIRTLLIQYEGEQNCHLICQSGETVRIFALQGKESVTGISALFDELKKRFKETFRCEISVNFAEVYSSVNAMIDEKVKIAAGSTDKVDTDSLLKDQMKLITTNILIGNFSTSKKMLMNILQHAAGLDSESMKRLVTEIFRTLSDFMQQNNKKLYQIIGPYLNCDTIMSMGSADQIVAYCDQVFDIMKAKEGLSDRTENSSIIRRIQEYTDRHIFEEIRLVNVADELFISSSQLNRILKNQTGETFLQFVTKRKMEKAMELLGDPQYKVYQVGERLGYKTRRHFSKLFYNFSGYYPIEYRKHILKIGKSTESNDQSED